MNIGLPYLIIVAIGGISFGDDVHSLPDSVQLAVLVPLVLVVAYVKFTKKYFHLHEEVFGVFEIVDARSSRALKFITSLPAATGNLIIEYDENSTSFVG